MKFWLDDIRPSPDDYIWCHSVREIKNSIIWCEDNNEPIEIVDCDHDLGDYACDGGDAIKFIDWLAERGTHYPINIHTMNPVGRENMQRTIDRYWR